MEKNSRRKQGAGSRREARRAAQRRRRSRRIRIAIAVLLLSILIGTAVWILFQSIGSGRASGDGANSAEMVGSEMSASGTEASGDEEHDTVDADEEESEVEVYDSEDPDAGDHDEENSPAAAAETVEPETETDPAVKTLKLTAVGDCALGKERSHKYGGSFDAYYANKGADYFLEKVRSLFQEDDLTLANLECALTRETKRVRKTYNIKGDPERTAILTGSSVDAVVLGNNHTMDYGEQGLQDTKAALDSAGIPWALNEDVARFVSDDGIRVSILSREMIRGTEGVGETMVGDVKRVKESGEANLIIACCHWGTERKYSPSADMVTLGHALIDAGADVVIGHHPHVLQGIEVYEGKVICYSLGNFCFGGNLGASDYDTMIYQQTFTFVDGVLQPDLEAQVLPAKQSSSHKRNNFQPMIAEGKAGQKIIERLNGWSSKLGDVVIDSEGKITTGSMGKEIEENEAVDG